MLRRLASWARKSTEPSPPMGIWESMWPRTVRDWRRFLKTTWGTVVIAVGIALGGSVGGLLGSASGPVWTAIFAVLAAIVAALAVSGIVLVVLGILTPSRQRDEVRTEYLRLLHPRMVSFSERRRRLTECAAQGLLILTRARCTDPQDEDAMDALWEDANRWEASAATTIAQIMGSAGLFWTPRVSDLPPRLEPFVTHIETKYEILRKLVDELPPADPKASSPTISSTNQR